MVDEVALRTQNVQRVVSVVFPKSKTDTDFLGYPVAVGCDHEEDATWQRVQDIIARHDKEERLIPLAYVQILKIFKEILPVDGDESKSYTGHSMKRGALQLLLQLGVDTKLLYLVSKHKVDLGPPEVTIRYLYELLPLVGLANGSVHLTNRL